MKFIGTYVLAACTLLLVGSINAQDNAPRFEQEILAFEASDRENRPAEGAILFIGSSSIRGWRTLADDFPGVAVINRGFGGSQIDDSIRLVDRIVLPYRPSMIVFYAGENDLSAGKSPEQVAADFRTFVQLVRAELPGTRIAFIAMKPSPRRWHLAEAKRTGNRIIQDFVSTAPGIDYIDVFGPMLNEAGEPRAEIFVGDNLHLNAEGYALWRELVLPYVKHHEAARGKE